MQAVVGKELTFSHAVSQLLYGLCILEDLITTKNTRICSNLANWQLKLNFGRHSQLWECNLIQYKDL